MMARTAVTLLKPCIGSQQQTQTQSLKETSRTLWSFARYVTLLYASSVSPAIVWMETGTEIYTAAKLLSAVPVEAKLRRLLAESDTLTRLEKNV